MFDKKNTMILTIVAVATLLVAVVGATFAYFSTGISGGPTTTKATVTTATPGSIVIDGGGETLTLKLSAADMMSNNTGKYYALDKAATTTTGDSESIHGTKNDPKKYTIATAKITDGGSGVTYNCGYSVKVTPKEDVVGLSQGDLVLALDGPSINGSGKNTKEIDLYNLKTTGVTENGTFSLTGPNGSSTIQAGLYLENRSADQNAIAGKTIELTIEVTGKECTIMANE